MRHGHPYTKHGIRLGYLMCRKGVSLQICKVREFLFWTSKDALFNCVQISQPWSWNYFRQFITWRQWLVSRWKINACWHTFKCLTWKLEWGFGKFAHWRDWNTWFMCKQWLLSSHIDFLCNERLLTGKLTLCYCCVGNARLGHEMYTIIKGRFSNVKIICVRTDERFGD